MPPVTGAQFRVEVETATPATFVDVADMDTFESSGSRSESTHRVFQRTTDYVLEELPTDTVTLSGLFSPADAGQLRLIAAYNGNTIIKLRVTQDGTAGWTQDFYVREQRRPVRPDGWQGISWTLRASGVKTVVSSGVLA